MNQIQYNILGLYSFNYNGWEVIDTAPNRTEARKLVQEYRLAFGNDWSIKLKRITA